MCLNRMKTASPCLVWCIRGSWKGRPHPDNLQTQTASVRALCAPGDTGLPGGPPGPPTFLQCPLAKRLFVYPGAMILPKARLSVPKAINKLAQAIIRPGGYYN